MICRFCGQEASGQLFEKWVKPTFTDHDKLLPGEIVCNDCLSWFDEKSQELAQLVGKDKPQRMRNYSHFIVNDKWIPLSKGNKGEMAQLLLGEPFPELAAIAESGQKHIVFRATRNPAGGRAGWVQFEEQQLWVEPEELEQLLGTINPALSTFSKTELATGQYLPYRVLQFGLSGWQILENELRALRGSLFFQLAMFLSQKGDDDAGNGGGPARNSVAGNKQRVQDPVSTDDLGTVREPGEGQCLHQQPGEIRQLGLFEAGSSDLSKAD